MTRYIALAHKEKRSPYGVQSPDVSGCFSAADDADDLIRNAAEALSLWAEDEPLPPPRSIDKITADKVVGRELAGGAFLISVPFSANDSRVVSANISLERAPSKPSTPPPKPAT